MRFLARRPSRRYRRLLEVASRATEGVSTEPCPWCGDRAVTLFVSRTAVPGTLGSGAVACRSCRRGISVTTLVVPDWSAVSPEPFEFVPQHR